MFAFSEIIKQVHAINDLILSDMAYQTEESVEEATSFSRHLLATKNWFSRISWANKKRFVLALLEDVRSAWTLSLLLKSLWNCRPKDAVLSSTEKHAWSSFDVVPMDHNRTAQPIAILAKLMKKDRLWFHTLDTEAQAMVLSELVTVAGGPVMWAVLRRAQVLYERYRDDQFQNIHECIVVNEPPTQRQPSASPGKVPQKDSSRKLPTENNDLAEAPPKQSGAAQKELESKLAAWNQTIKVMKDNLKLEELEMTFTDGTKRKIWKVNRPKPEAIETVDFLQLLPSSVGKLILSYVPRSQLPELVKVNKYWAYLVEELRNEQTTQQKLQSDFQKLQEVMLRHDTSLEQMEQINVPNGVPHSSQGNVSTALSLKARAPPSMMWASVKSGGAFSMRQFLSGKPPKKIQIPIRNMAELTERLDRRGAADENLWAWCENVLKQANTKGDSKTEHPEGVLVFRNVLFPCPLMKKCLEVPLKSLLYKDPAMIAPLKPRKNISTANVLVPPKEQEAKRYNLWTRDFSGLYPVFKIPSYHYSM